MSRRRATQTAMGQWKYIVRCKWTDLFIDGFRCIPFPFSSRASSARTMAPILDHPVSSPTTASYEGNPLPITVFVRDVIIQTESGRTWSNRVNSTLRLVRTLNVGREINDIRWRLIFHRTHAIIMMRWLRLMNAMKATYRLSTDSLALADGILDVNWVKCLGYVYPKLIPLPRWFADGSVVVVFFDITFPLAGNTSTIEDVLSYANRLHDGIRTLRDPKRNPYEASC